MRHILALLLILCGFSVGQSTYQRLGYGNLYQPVDPFATSLGTGVIALEDSSRITFWNPAALNSLKRVYFGAVVGSNFISTDVAVTNNTRFQQVMIGLPLGKNVGLSLAMRPIANFAAKYQTNLIEGDLAEVSSGGVWDYSAGFGARIKPNLQLGVKYHLLHGLFRRAMTLTSDVLSQKYVLEGSINGSSAEIGAIVGLGEMVNLGLTVNFATATPLFSGEDSLGGSSNFNSFEEELSAWPTTIRLGVVYRHSARTLLLAGISQQLFLADGFVDSRLFAPPPGWEVVPVGSFQVGILRSPADRTSRSWIKRTGWQTGFSFKNHYLSSNSNNLIYELSWNSGLNMSLRNGRSLFDVSAEIGTRSGEESLPSEVFARLKFGIQVNEIWFREAKRR